MNALFFSMISSVQFVMCTCLFDSPSYPTHALLPAYLMMEVLLISQKERADADFPCGWNYITKQKKISLLRISQTKVYFNILFFPIINASTKYISKES